MKSYFSVISASLATFVVACASSSDPAATTQPSGTAKSAIIKGTDSDESQDAVIRLVFFDRTNGEIGACTGTMLAPNLVLTARHCVARTDEGASCKTDGTPVGAGKVYESRKTSDLYVFKGVKRPAFGPGGPKPDATVSQIIDDGAKTLCSHDVALVVLTDPITDIPIAPIRLDSPPVADEDFTAVGWGITDKTQDPEIRQQRDLKVVSVGPATTAYGISAVEFETGEGICSGDSGGPALAKSTGAVIGVVSRGGNGTQGTESNPAAGCIGASTQNIFSFPAGFKDLIMKGFEAAGAEPYLENGPDPRLGKSGVACTDGSACQSATCLSSGNAKVCAPFDCKTEACPSNYECKANNAGKNVCEAKPQETTTTTTSSCSTAGGAGSSGMALGSLLVVGLCALTIRRRSRRGLADASVSR